MNPAVERGPDAAPTVAQGSRRRRNSPSIDMLLGSMVQLLANVVERVDPAVVREVIEEARAGPPPMIPL